MYQKNKRTLLILMFRVNPAPPKLIAQKYVDTDVQAFRVRVATKRDTTRAQDGLLTARDVEHAFLFLSGAW